MKYLGKLLALGIVAASTVIAVPSTAQGTIAAEQPKALSNRSFETPEVRESEIPVHKHGESIGAWRVRGNVHVSSRWPAADGKKYVHLMPCMKGGVWQKIHLEPGNYLLQFTMAGDPESTSGTKDNWVLASAGTPGNIGSEFFTADSNIYKGRDIKTVKDMSWQEQSVPFTVVAGDTTIEVEFMTKESGQDCFGALIDNVRITPQP